MAGHGRTMPTSANNHRLIPSRHPASLMSADRRSGGGTAEAETSRLVLLSPRTCETRPGYRASINGDALTSDIWAPDISFVVLSEAREASQADTVSCGSVSGSGCGQQFRVSSECESCGCENSQIPFRGRHGCENSGLLCQVCGYERLVPKTPEPNIAERDESIPASFCRELTTGPVGPGPCLSHNVSPFSSPGTALSQDEVHVRAFDNASSWDEEVNRKLRLEWEANGDRVVRSMQSGDSVTIRNQSEEWMDVSIFTDAIPRPLRFAGSCVESARHFDNFDQEPKERPESPVRRKQSVREPEATPDIPNKAGQPQLLPVNRASIQQAHLRRTQQASRPLGQPVQATTRRRESQNKIYPSTFRALGLIVAACLVAACVTRLLGGVREDCGKLWQTNGAEHGGMHAAAASESLLQHVIKRAFPLVGRKRVERRKIYEAYGRRESVEVACVANPDMAVE